MIVEAGHFALMLALALSLLQFAVPFWGARQNDATLMGVADAAALGQLLFVGAPLGPRASRPHKAGGTHAVPGAMQ